MEDIEPEILAIANIVIDHGLRKFHMYGASSTLLNVETFEVVRYGAASEVIADVISRHFDAGCPHLQVGRRSRNGSVWLGLRKIALIRLQREHRQRSHSWA